MIDWFNIDVCNFSFDYDLLSEFFYSVCKNFCSQPFINKWVQTVRLFLQKKKKKKKKCLRGVFLISFMVVYARYGDRLALLGKYHKFLPISFLLNLYFIPKT